MSYVDSDDFKVLLPLMGKEYFFPDLPLGGRMKSPFLESDVYDSDDEDERQQYFDSKIDYSGMVREVPQYPCGIENNVINLDSCNFDIVSLLSTEKRDYLVRNDNYGNGDHNQVKVVSLSNKRWVMVCCFFCPGFSNSTHSTELRAVSSVCADLYDHYSGDFEMVLVLKMKKDFQVDESAFRHMLSGFPSSCLVVPFWDSYSCNSICSSLGFGGRGKGLFVHAEERKVIWHKSLSFFEDYGVDAFPFTNDGPLKTWFQTRRELWNIQSLETLFCCSSSMVLGKSRGGADWFETTSIEQLKEKLVGVYLCLNGDLIPWLHQIYECCKTNNKAFEIVVVYCPFSTRNSDAQLFQKLINRALEKRKLSLWVLPFKSWVSLKLKRLCNLPTKDEVIIVGKEFVDPHGAYVIQKFGMSMYPFSRQLMFQSETERVSKVDLESLLVYGGRDYLLRNHLGGQDKVPVTCLEGKNVFIYADYDGTYLSNIVSGPLLEYYFEMKAKDSEFEMVYVGSRASLFRGKPWLICPYDIHHLDLVFKLIFADRRSRTTLVALKKDGLVGSIQAHKHLSSRGVQAYPFDGTGLKQEIIDGFKSRYHDLPLDDL